MSGEWLGYMAAVLTTLSFVPQAIKTIRSRDTSGISISMYVLFTAGVGFWLAYGIALGSWPMIGCNLVTLLLAGTILCLKIRYR
ncbi:MAG: SemiSWEET transporter [Pseudomonadota bacterium]|nr:SemiSWEET transporter [Pseudomonadota bacterium]